VEIDEKALRSLWRGAFSLTASPDSAGLTEDFNSANPKD
jgi:hypothetical protein